MNNFSFSKSSLAGVAVQGLNNDAFDSQLKIEDAARETEVRQAGEMERQNFSIMDVVEPSPSIGSNFDFNDAMDVCNTLEDGPGRFALFNELEGYQARRVLEDCQSPYEFKEARDFREKTERMDALSRDWKQHPEARKKVVEAYGEEWVKAFEAVPDDHKDRVRGDKVLEEFYSRPGDKDADSLIRYLMASDAPDSIRGSKDVWARWFAGRRPFMQEEEKEAEVRRGFATKSFPVMRAIMEGESFMKSLDEAENLTPEERRFAILNCGPGTEFAQSVERAGQWLQKNGFGLISRKDVAERSAKYKEDYELAMKSPATIVAWSRRAGWDANASPEQRALNDLLDEGGGGVLTGKMVAPLAKALLDLKREDPSTYQFVMGLYQFQADAQRNNGTTVVSPFMQTMRNMGESSLDFFASAFIGEEEKGDKTTLVSYFPNSFPVHETRDKDGRLVARKRSTEYEQAMSELRGIQKDIAESPDGASWIRRQFDGLGSMSAQTAYYLATYGAGTFTAVANDRAEELRSQGVGDLEALFRGVAAGGTEVLVERLGGESLFKTLKLVGRRMPFARSFTGYVGGAADMLKRGMYGNAAARYGSLSLGAGISEWTEEFVQPTLQAPLDAGLARLFGSSNGMTVEDWKDQINQVADLDLGVQMMMFGAVVGGAQVPAFAREARISRVSAPQIMGLGVERAEAERIAKIVDPVQKNQEIWQAAMSVSDKAAALENVNEGFRSMQDDFSWLNQQEAYQAEVELLNLPRVEDLGNGNWRFTTTVRNAEGKESYDAMELNDQDATAQMRTLLHEGVRMRMLEAQQDFAVERTIDQLEKSGRYVFEDMGRAETVETARKLASAARLRIEDGADVNAEATDIGTRMTYGQAATMGETLDSRVQLGVKRGEVAHASRARSNAYRVAMNNGQTLIRYHKGEVTVPELLEEVLETHLTEDMANTRHSLDWYTANLRALQDALQKDGYLGKGKDLIRRDGEASIHDVIEGMSMLSKGDVLARAADMRLPQWMKDFMQMVRQWVSAAKALLDLGNGLHEMERRAKAGEQVPIDADFARAIHELSNNLEGYWMQEGARQGEAAVKQIVKDVTGVDISMSLSDGGRIYNPLILAEDRAQWEKSLDGVLSGEVKDSTTPLKVCSMPDVLSAMGITGRDLVMSPGVVEKVMHGKHDLTREQMLQLPEALHNPILIVDSATQANALAILTAIRTGEGNVLAALHLDKNTRQGIHHVIASAYGKQSGTMLIEQMKNGHTRFINKKRALAWARSARLQLPGVASQKGKFNVLEQDDVVKWKERDDTAGEVSFSLSEGFPLTVSRGTQSLEVVRRIAADLRADAATWGRYAGKTDEAAFLVNVGRNVAMVKSALMHLPAGYRVAVKPYIDRLQILAELAAKGAVDETRMVNAFARREIRREMKEAIEEEIIQLKQEAAFDIEEANRERLAGKKGELNGKTEALYRSLDYQDRTAVRKAYNERNKRIISIRKRYKNEGYIAQRIERENAKFEQALSKYKTREEKLTDQITKLETRINSLKVRNVSDKQVNDASREAIAEVRKAWAEKRLNQLIADVMTTASVKMDEVAKEGIAAGIAKMLDKALKVRKKNGKQQKGMVSVEAYAHLRDQISPLLRMSAEEKEAAIREAEAELEKLEEENPDQMDGVASARMEELNEELTRLTLYGNLDGMNVDEAETAAKAIETFIQTEKEAWAAVQDAATERLNAIGRKIVDAFDKTGKKADENTLRAANEKFHGNVSFKDIGDFMENMDQLLTRMGAMPALRDLTADMRSRLTNAFQQLRDARGMRAAAVQDLYEKHITEKVMKARKVRNMAGWVTWFKTSHDTGVKLSGWVSQSAQLTLEKAREVREMDASQRREFIRKRWEEGQEYFSEEVLDMLVTRLKEYDDVVAQAKAEGKRAPYRKYVTAKAAFQGEEGSPLVMSRDNAMQVILLSEQESYREMMKQQGYTPEVISLLREYVGEEGMFIGYGLREMLKVQGDKIGELYEQVTGVPFPREMNYYPARFWALDAMSDADAADMISGVPSTKGGNKGWQKVRTKHHRRLDTSVGALSVFWEATDITDHWYYTQDITTDFRGLLKRREVAESLVTNLGKDDFVRLRRWVDLLERAGVVQGQAVGSLDKTLNAIYSGQAKAILAFRFETLLKQGSAVLNAWVGDPGIGLTDYLFTMAKMRNNTAEMGVIKMLKSAEFQARLNGKMDVETLSRLKDDSSYTLAEAALVFGMNGIEYTDVFFNAVGSAALWNIKYRQAMKAGMEEGAAKDEAWQAVRNALHSAQPQTWIDKSFGGLNRGTWGRVIFYMMSENFNKTASIYGLARMGFAKGATPKQRRASLAKSGKVWLAYGAFNALIGALLDYMKDDEEEWENRGWLGYALAAIAGPVSGMPLAGEAVEWLCSMAGLKVYTGSAGRALIDVRSGWNAGVKLWDMMEEGDHEFQDYMKQVIRLGRVFGAAGGVASGAANKGVQAVGQYMTLGAALMNPAKTVADVVD